MPPVPETIEDTGLSPEALADLVLKTLYVQGARTGQQLVDVIKRPFPCVDSRLLDLQQRRLLEVRGTTGSGSAGYRYALTDGGRDRARQYLDISQYVGAARAKGMPRRTVVAKHAFRNAGVQVLTMSGWEITRALAGFTVVVEKVFAWPGLGSTIVQSIIAKDYPVVQGIVLVYGVGVLLVNLVVDVALALLDPRSTIRES